MTAGRLIVGVFLVVLSVGSSHRASAASSSAARPNIVLIMVDNLGWGELGVYGGGTLRGAPTPRLDALAAQGMRLQNFNVEYSCTPSRSALMTGRFAVRSGTFGEPKASTPGGKTDNGLVRWEITLAELLSREGYSTALYGKWHLGEQPGRYPNDRGFDEWYGISTAAGHALFRLSPGYDPTVTPPDDVLEGRKGGATTPVKEFDVAAREEIDTEITQRAATYIRDHAGKERPFFLYLPLTQVHSPTLPGKAFRGRTGNGDFADSVVEMDHHVGQILDTIDESGIAQRTIVVFMSDNGPDNHHLGRGTSGFWRGYMRTALEGSLRTPFIIRWPGKVPVGVTNEIVHIVDLFPTLARVAGASIPTDRPIDGVDQLDFLLGAQDKSKREGFPFYWRGELYAVKWRDWKLHFVWRPDYEKAPVKLVSPYLFNLLVDPKEESPRALNMEDRWARGAFRALVADFEKSLAEYPPIKPHTPDPYIPPKPAPRAR